MSALEPSVQRYGALELRIGRRELLVGGRCVPVGGRAWDVLLALVERRDRVVPKQELLDLVWRDAPVEEGNLQTQISALRRHIGRDAIATVPGRGYRFVLAPVAAAEGNGPTAGKLGLLLGRAAERGQLARAVDAGSVALLCGDAGMGKSRLLADLAQTHPLGPAAFAVASARPGDAVIPYATAARWLRLLAARRPTLPQGSLGDELARAVPEWGTPLPTSESDGRARLVRACAAVIDDAVQAGLRALLLDDLHFADDASAGLLQPLLDERRCAWVLAAREHELPPAARALFDAQSALSTTWRLTLPPLDLASTEQLLAAFGHPVAQRQARAQALLRHTGGNPLFVIETLHLERARGREPSASRDAAAAWPLSHQVKRVIRRRLDALQPGARRLLRVAAVAGEDLEPDLAAALLDTDALALADDWAELEVAQVLQGCAFAHDLVAEAASELVPAPIAASLHAQVAAWLEPHGAEPARVAAHWLASNTPRKAVPSLLAAAQRARAASCPLRAHDHFAQAGDILRAAGETAAAFDAWFAAAEARSEVAVDAAYATLCERLQAAADGDEGRLAMAGLARLAILVEARRHDEALAACGEALQHARHADLPDIEVELLWGEVIIRWERRELGAALAQAKRALARIPDIDVGRARLDSRATHQKLVQILGKLHVAAGDYGAAQAQLHEAEALALRLGDPGVVAAAAIAVTGCRLERGDAVGARQGLMATLDALSGREWLNVTRAQALGLLARLHLACGDPGAALATSQQAVALCRDSHVRHEFRLRREHHALAHRLGQAAGLAGLDALRHEPGMDRLTRVLVEATWRWAGGGLQPVDRSEPGSLLSEVAQCPDFPLRAELLCQLQHDEDSAGPALLLQIQVARAQAEAAAGVWLSLAGAEVALLRRLGRADEAAAIAARAWRRLAAGGAPAFEPFSDLACVLHQALVDVDVAFAETIALRASAWAQQAASTLAPDARRPFLTRALARLTWPAAPGARRLR